MLIKNADAIAPSEITPESIYVQRRKFLQYSVAATSGLLLAPLAQAKGILPSSTSTDGTSSVKPKDFPQLKPNPFSTEEALTPLEEIKSYSNFYELGTAKTDPLRYGHLLKTEPWSVLIVGEVEKPSAITLEDLLRLFPLEERIYRLRCVEGWSMVIPWVGFPLNQLIKRFNPTSKAKYVQFETLYDPEQMPGQKRNVLNWPYKEGLRMDEALHPLTILSVGLYGQMLPAPNGAPIRLVVPWKYGFKSIKSIVKIKFMAQQPLTSWVENNADEYGFYANVNPDVAHPRWSQARERRIGALSKRETLMFNGYAEQVAGLYTDMDLRKHY